MSIVREPPKPGAMQFRFAEIEKDATRPRTVRFVASDESVDRYGDIIRVSGWNLEPFKKNPVLLFAHNSRDLPIGTADAWVDLSRKALLADATFLSAEQNDFADQVWRIVEAGALRAVSVGFMPTETPNILRDDKNEWITGFEFIAQELLELSVVPVPANPNALALARSVSTEAAICRLFTDDDRARALAAAAGRRRSIDIARLRGGGGRHHVVA